MKQYNITIIEYTDDKSNEWDNFVLNSNNGTIFHQQKFLAYHPTNKFNFNHYLIYNNNTLVAILPGGYDAINKTYWSPTGASYGGIITQNITFELAINIVDKLIQFFKDKGANDIYIIPPPLIYSKIYNQHIEYAMLYRQFDFQHHYISHTLNLDNNYNLIFAKKIKSIINIANANPNLIINEVNSFDTIYPILLNNKAKHNATPTHSLNDLIKLKNTFPTKIRQFNVTYNDKVIAGSTMFLANDCVALCFYNVLDYDYQHLHPTYLLADYLIKWARENGYKWFDFGVSQDTTADNPMTPSLSLIHFKEHFNMRGIFRSTYHLSL